MIEAKEKLVSRKESSVAFLLVVFQHIDFNDRKISQSSTIALKEDFSFDINVAQGK